MKFTASVRRTLVRVIALCAAMSIFIGQAAAQTAAPSLTTLHTFTAPLPDGINPTTLVTGSNGVLYGTTQYGGAGPCSLGALPPGCGTVFSLTPPSSPGGAWTEAVLYSFSGGSDGDSPVGISVASGPGGSQILYGATQYGGSGSCSSPPFAGCGTVFSLTPPSSAAGAWTKQTLYTFTGGSDGAGPAVPVIVGNSSGGITVLYGTTQFGGAATCTATPGYSGCGTVFSLTPPTQAVPANTPWNQTVLYSFPAGSGGVAAFPQAITLGTNVAGSPALYGATQYGGTGSGCGFTNGCGFVFSLTAAAPTGPWTEADLYNFTGGADGAYTAGVAIGNGGALYAASQSIADGAVIALIPPGAASAAWNANVLYAFQTGSTTIGFNPAGAITVGAGGIVYGATTRGGASGSGAVFALTPPGSSGGPWSANVLYSFPTGFSLGSQSYSAPVIGNGGVIYGATAFGGYGPGGGSGTIYSLTPPAASGGAWTEATLYRFSGGSPSSGTLSSVVVGAGGVLYGTTEGGGAGACPLGCGTIFSLTPPVSANGPWTETTLYTFTGGADGAYPSGGLSIGIAGVLYGTAQYGGAGSCTATGEPAGCGAVFSLAPPATSAGEWQHAILYNFAGVADGAYPATGVALSSGGILYGTTSAGGGAPSGTVFSLTPPASPFGGDWTEAVLYNFDSRIESLAVSADPSGLAMSGGALYGMAILSYGYTAYSLSPPQGGNGPWTETTLYASGCFFCGVNPSLTSGLAIGNGAVYGIASSNTNGNTQYAFAMPTGGGTASLYNFANPGETLSTFTVGSEPNGDSVLYGASQFGGSGPCVSYGATGCGTVYALIPSASPGAAWAETTLYNFTGSSDGGYPLTPVTISAQGSTLYGTTSGPANTGTVFALAIGSGLLPSLNAGGVVNAASYTTQVAPGSIASAFGSFLLSSPQGAVELPLPESLGGLSLEFAGGLQAPMFYASNGQINFQVPWEVSVSPQASLAASLDGGAGTTQPVNVVPVAPAIFSTSATGSGQGAILDAAYRLVDAANPATAGVSVVMIYCTGLGDVTNRPATGSPALSDPVSMSAMPTVTISGADATVQFAGLAPGYVGLYQVNALVPAGSATGSSVPVTISLSGQTSNTVTMAVQ